MMAVDLGLDDEVSDATKRIFSGYRRAVEELIEDGGRSDRNPFGSLALLDSAAGVSIGQVLAYAGDEAPTDYLECNGANVSRATYAALFRVIDVLYGSGDGSTTFGLPDLRGTMLVGAGGTRIAGPNPAPGSKWGNDSVELEAANLPRHRHGAGTLQTDAGGSHTHTYYYGSTGSGQQGGSQGGNATTDSGGGHSHNLTGSVAPAGAGEAMSVIQPTMELLWIIKAQ